MLIILLTNVYLQLHFQPIIIGKIIQNPDSNKAYVHNNLSLRMLKIWGDSRQILRKKGSIVPNHKTGDK